MNRSAENQPLKRLLAMDTSTSSMTVALLDGERLIAESGSIAVRNHSMYLVPSMLDMLESVQISLQDIDGIGVGRGPGSYTGVRIGASVAKTLAWTLGVPLIGVSSLEAMALGGVRSLAAQDPSPDPVLAVPMIDARRGRVYTGLYRISKGISTCLLPDGVRPLDTWLKQIAAYIPESADGGEPGTVAGILFVGETSPFRGRLPASESWQGCTVRTADTRIRAYDVGLLAARRWSRGEQDDVHTFVPNYTQLADAEAKYLARQKQAGGLEGSAGRGRLS